LLKKEVNRGLLYFEKNPSHVGTKMWRRFKRVVLKPFHRAEMDKLKISEREDVNRVLEVFGGGIVPDQTRQPASLEYLKEALGLKKQGRKPTST